MDSELHKLITKRYPVYNQKHHPHTIFGQWGFECGAGWLELFIELAERLNEMGVEPKHVDIRQIKEKMWAGRFYVYVPAYADSDEYDDFIDDLENCAAETCQFCGSKKDRSIKQHDCDPEHRKTEYLLEWYRYKLFRG